MHTSEERLLDQAKQMIDRDEATCIVIKDNEIVHQASGRGVAPLMHLYRNDREKLAGTVVADKVIGKAAAMILVRCGAAHVHGVIMSEAGKEFLEAHETGASYGLLVERIASRDGTGICPIENSVLDTDDVVEGIVNITQTIAELMKAR